MSAVSSLELRAVTDPGELAQVDSVYRRTFGIRSDDSGLNLRLLVGITENSGHLVGAWDGRRLVGFGLSFLARDEASGRLYRYSQTVAVLPDEQVRGIGRAIKYAQRDAALADGIDLMRWVYDPMQARNAHFNLDVLGGTVRRLRRDLYGTAAPGRDDGERTDRVIIDWELACPVAPIDREPPAELPLGESLEVAGLLAIAIPSDWYAYRRSYGDDHAAEMRARTTDLMAAAVDRGLAALSCQKIDDHSAVYLFAPDGQP